MGENKGKRNNDCLQETTQDFRDGLTEGYIIYVVLKLGLQWTTKGRRGVDKDFLEEGRFY